MDDLQSRFPVTRVSSMNCIAYYRNKPSRAGVEPSPSATVRFTNMATLQEAIAAAQRCGDQEKLKAHSFILDDEKANEIGRWVRGEHGWTQESLPSVEAADLAPDGR